MELSNNKLVVFDLDGTLNRTELYAVPAHKKALADLGIYDKTDADIIANFGARATDAIPNLIGECDEETGFEYLRKVTLYENEFIKEFAGEYDGVSDLLDDLGKNGYKTAVCSNASERYIRMVLTSLNLIDKVDYIQPLLPEMTKNDTLKLLIERVIPNKAIMVGDRIFDKLAAKHNNIPFIGCLYGFEKSEVEDADIAVNSPREILDAVKKLIG